MASMARMERRRAVSMTDLMSALWLTVMKDDLKNKLAEVLPTGVKVTVLADRGFGDTKLFGSSRRKGAVVHGS